MAFPTTLPTITGGTLAAAADINTIMDAILGLRGVGTDDAPFAMLTSSTNYTITSTGSFEGITMDTTVVETVSGMVVGSQLEAPIDAWYEVGGVAEFENGEYNKDLVLANPVGGAIYAYADSHGLSTPTPARLHVSRPMFLTAGDGVILQGMKDGATSRQVTGGSDYSPFVWMRWIPGPFS